jgi:hypothetical protein
MQSSMDVQMITIEGVQVCRQSRASGDCAPSHNSYLYAKTSISERDYTNASSVING